MEKHNVPNTKFWLKIGVVLFMVTSMVLTPISGVFAQEVSPVVTPQPAAQPNSSASPDSSGAVDQPKENSGQAIPPSESDSTVAPPQEEVMNPKDKDAKPDKKLDKDKSAEPIKQDAKTQAATASSALAVPQASQMKFELPAQSQASIDESTGSLSYGYPIELPEGRAGMTPELSLKYDSRSNSELGSIAGLGWDISIPFIKREPINGTQNLYNKAYFSSSLSGNLVATTDTTSSQYTTYRNEVEQGDYQKYVYNSNNTWTVTGKDGRTLTFGETSASRQDKPGDSTKVYKWMLSKITDTHGNQIQYSYIKDSGQIYPSQILYTYHATATAAHTVSFAYTNPASYGSTVYNSGFPVTTYKLLNTIIVSTTIDAQTSSSTYTFNYSAAQFLNQKLLSSITKTNSLASYEYNQSFNDTTSFTYSSKTPGWQQGTHSLQGYLNDSDGTIYQDIYTVDFDNNGYEDILVSDQVGNNLAKYLLTNNGTNFIDTTTAWNLPPFDTSVTFAIVDVNGDKLPDFHPRWYNDQPSQNNTYLNTGSAFVEDTSDVWVMKNYVPEANCGPNASDQYSSLINTFLSDINGDGKNDIIWFGGTGSNRFKVYLNNGNGWSVSNDYTFTAAPGASFTIEPQCGGQNTNNNYQTLLDFNGDGLLDYYHQTYGVYLNNGTGYSYSSSYSVVTSEMNRSGIADINGDGLVDFIGFKYYSGANRCSIVYLNDGNGLIMVNPSAFPPCATNTTWDPVYLYFTNNSPSYFGITLDVTSDGLPDILGASNANSNYGKVRAINDGKGWVGTPTGGSNLWNPLISPNYAKFLDVNSDGILDWITASTNWDGTNSYPTKVYMGKSAVPNRLTKITSALGAETVIDYSTSPTNGNEISTSPMPVVSKITTQNVGSGQPSMVSSYTYSGGAYLADPNTKQKRFVGFQKVTSTESGTDLVPLRVTETYFHQGNGSDSATNEPSDTDLVKVGKPYYSIVRSPNSVTKKETWQKYGTTTLVTEPVIGRTSKFIYPSETVTKNTDGATRIGSAYVNSFDTTLMEQTESRSLGAVTVNNDGSYTDISGDTRYQFTEYSNNSGSTIVKPKRVDIRTGSASNTTIARTDYYYDSQSLGTIGSLGDLTKESSWIAGDGTTVADTNYTYDSYGNLATIVNPRNATTSFTYDSSKSLLASQTNQLGHVTSYEYMTGLLKKITDPNGRITTITYSSVGLPYHTTVINNGGSKSTWQFFENSNLGGVWVARTDTELVSSVLDRSWQSVDNLGRPIRQVKRLLDHDSIVVKGLYVKEDIDYDVLGRVIARSAPSGTVNTGDDYYVSLQQTVTSNLYTNTTYDVFDRPLTVSDNIGTTQYAYAGLQTTITDAKNNQKKLKIDSYGNLVEVKEYNNSNVYTTSYEYDNRNLLTKITDALGNIRNFTYNNAGLIVNSEDLHAVNDSIFGTYAYTYDVNGNVLTETQPNGVVVTKTYDLLDRALTVDSSSTPGVTDFTYTYDACTNGKGHVCTVVGSLPNSVSLNKTYVYGIAGSPTSVTLTTGGNSYTTSYLYTKSDVVSKVTYPNGTVVRTVFGDWGLPTKIYTTLPAGAETLNSTITYHHTEQPATIVTSNGQTTTYNYDSAKLYRKSSASTTIGGSTVQSYNYAYDAVGNITSITEPTVTKTYSYDDLSRLTQAVYTPTSGGATTYSYQYDAIGNITQANGQTYTYSGTGKTNPHAVTSVGANNYTYDDNGNMLTAPNQTFTYNWQNQMQSVVLNGTTTINSSYDESGQRFLYQTPTTTEIAASGGYLLRNGTPEISIALGSLPLGVISGTNIYSSVSDHLGTPVKQYNSSGIIVEDNTYGPYGTTLTHTGSVDTKDGYTGHQEDTDTGLVYANARYYNPSIGRFLSQDPEFWSLPFIYLVDPQQQNSYSYARNNPVVFSDPTGNSVGVLQLIQIGVSPVALPIEAAAVFSVGVLTSVTTFFVNPKQESHENLTPQERAIINPPTAFIGPVNPNVTPYPAPRAAAKPNITVSPLSTPKPIDTVYIDGTNYWVGPGPISNVYGIPDADIGSIANGHAWNDHKNQYPQAKNPSDLEKHIGDLLNTPGNPARYGPKGRIAIGGNDGSVIVYNPGTADKGTIFKPKKGVDRWLKENFNRKSNK